MPRIRAASIAEHKQLTRDALLDAAFRLFVANGFSRTSLRDVAGLADVGRTTLYEYFANKEELFLALVEARVPSVLEAAVAELPDLPPLDRIQRVYEQAFAVLGDHLDLARILFVVGRELPLEVRERMWSVLWPMNGELLHQCQIGIENGLFPAVDPGLLHQTIADLLVGGVDQVLALGYSDDFAQSVLETRVRFLRQGITGGAALP